MTINITDISKAQKLVPSTGKNPVSHKGRATPDPTTSMDKVTITETATKLKHALKSLSDGQVVDSKRVEQIKHAIDDGRYKIDTLKIASQLIRFEKDL